MATVVRGNRWNKRRSTINRPDVPSRPTPLCCDGPATPPKLLVAIVDDDGATGRVIELTDPRETYCRVFNALNVGAKGGSHRSPRFPGHSPGQLKAPIGIDLRRLQCGLKRLRQRRQIGPDFTPGHYGRRFLGLFRKLAMAAMCAADFVGSVLGF